MVVWNGKPAGFKVIRNWFQPYEAVPEWFSEYNMTHDTWFYIREQAFPKDKPYGWKNYPYDYYNIWVAHAGEDPYMEEPTLEMLAPEWDMIVFKHCFPVGKILPDKGMPDPASEEKRLENYKVQYLALRDKLHQFPETKFVVWTGAALVEKKTTEEQARRMKAFVDWVRDEWDQPEDNIYLWDFYQLETEGGLYLKNEYARNPGNSHPSKKFGERVSALFCNRLVDVALNYGHNTTLTGENK
ncbi:MAG: hypothetical protein Kow00127_25060 [Bacteroidales bacterium]